MRALTGSGRSFRRTLAVLTVASLAVLGLPATPAGAATLTVCDTGCDYTSIQGAINVAAAGDVVAVGAGTYIGKITLDERITLVGAGADTVLTTGGAAGPVVSITAPLYGTDRVTISDVLVTNYTGAGISVGVDHVTLDGVTTVGPGAAVAGSYGVAVAGLTNVDDLVITDADLSAAAIGLKIPSTTGLTHLTIADSEFRANTHGIYADSPNLNAEPSARPATLAYVSVTGTSFVGNLEKGIYIERLSHATFDGLTFTGNGSAVKSSSRGLNLNLKYGDYSDISITDSVFTDNALGAAAAYGAAVTIAARNDSAYAGNPATLTGLDVQGVTVTGSPVGVSIENDVDLASTTITYSWFQNTLADLVINGTDAGEALATMNAFEGTAYAVAALTGTADATANWWGQDTGPALGQTSGTVSTEPWIHAYTPDPTKTGEPGFWPIDITYAYAPVTIDGTTDPDPVDVKDPSGATISVDLPTFEGEGTLTVESMPVAEEEGYAFSAGTIAFDISFTGTLGQPAEICLTYPGGGSWPIGTRLYHYVEGAWTDITTSLDGGTLCGMTDSFSPFAAGILMVGDPPVVANVDASPATQAYGGDVTVTADVTDPDGASNIDTVEYSLDESTWYPMVLVSGDQYRGLITRPAVGTYTVTVRATDDDTNSDSDTETFTITEAESFVAYTGTAYITSPAGLKLEATVSGSCKAGRQVEFFIDLNEDSVFADPDEMVGTAITNSAGVAVLSYGSLSAGDIKDVRVSVDATPNCSAAVGTSVIIVAGTGDSSNGGGSYTNNGRMNFGYSVQMKTNKKTQVTTVSGELLWQKQGSTRIKGIVTGFTTDSAYCPPGYTGTVTCALITGSASIYVWEDDAWVLDATNVAFKIKVADGGTSSTCAKKNGGCTTTLKPDFIQMFAPAMDVAGYQVKGGNIVVRATA